MHPITPIPWERDRTPAQRLGGFTTAAANTPSITPIASTTSGAGERRRGVSWRPGHASTFHLSPSTSTSANREKRSTLQNVPSIHRIRKPPCLNTKTGRYWSLEPGDALPTMNQVWGSVSGNIFYGTDGYLELDGDTWKAFRKREGNHLPDQKLQRQKQLILRSLQRQEEPSILPTLQCNSFS